MSDGPFATPLSDLRAMALKHYEGLSMSACDWMSTIPRAINFYFDAKERDAPSPAPVETGTREESPPAMPGPVDPPRHECATCGKPKFWIVGSPASHVCRCTMPATGVIEAAPVAKCERCDGNGWHAGYMNCVVTCMACRGKGKVAAPEPEAHASATLDRGDELPGNRMAARVAYLEAALRKITKREGLYSPDWEHANNTLNEIGAIASGALDGTWEDDT